MQDEVRRLCKLQDGRNARLLTGFWLVAFIRAIASRSGEILLKRGRVNPAEVEGVLDPVHFWYGGGPGGVLQRWGVTLSK